jgi:hypothetical protein
MQTVKQPLTVKNEHVFILQENSTFLHQQNDKNTTVRGIKNDNYN